MRPGNYQTEACRALGRFRLRWLPVYIIIWRQRLDILRRRKTARFIVKVHGLFILQRFCGFAVIIAVPC